MSTNAFARSRPRVRHQRVPRTHSCEHPRFLQLVNELSRLNELKRKQEEAETDGRGDNCTSDDQITSTNASTNNNATSSSSSITNNNICATSADSDLINRGCSVGNTGNNSCGATSVNRGIASGRTVTTNICSDINLNGNGSGCCTSSTSINNNATQSSNGYRSLDCHPSSTSHNSNYSSNQHHHHHHHHHHIHQHNNQHPQNYHTNPLNHNQHPTQHHYVQNEQHQLTLQQQFNDRCPGKCSTSSFGYSKQNLVLDQAAGHLDYTTGNINNNSSNNTTSNSSNASDLRQDENRSKRKRSGAESTSSRKNSVSACSSNGSSKRHKSASEATRPLSPSFTKCPICLLDCMDRVPSFTNTCFHLFCYVCIENWTKNKATCPLCRTKFTKIVYNIKSATNYEEKVASPIRRDEDDGYAERFMLEHLTNLNYNTTMSSRNNNSEDVQFLFENLSRNPDVLPQYFVNQMDPRQGESLHSFNTIAAPTNFNSNVPHPSFTSTNYPIATTNYIVSTLLPRMAPMASTAITSAYAANTSLTNINNDPSVRRTSNRSGRFIHSRPNFDPQSVDNSTRVTRTSNNLVNQPVVGGGVIPLERHNPNQHQHQNHHQHHQLNQHRGTIELNPRLNQRLEQSHASQMSLPYQVPVRHYNQQNIGYSRRSYNQPQIEHNQHNLDDIYRQIPDM